MSTKKSNKNGQAAAAPATARESIRILQSAIANILGIPRNDWSNPLADEVAKLRERREKLDGQMKVLERDEAHVASKLQKIKEAIAAPAVRQAVESKPYDAALRDMLNRLKTTKRDWKGGRQVTIAKPGVAAWKSLKDRGASEEQIRANLKALTDDYPYEVKCQGFYIKESRMHEGDPYRVGGNALVLNADQLRAETRRVFGIGPAKATPAKKLPVAPTTAKKSSAKKKPPKRSAAVKQKPGPAYVKWVESVRAAVPNKLLVAAAAAGSEAKRRMETTARELFEAHVPVADAAAQLAELLANNNGKAPAKAKASARGTRVNTTQTLIAGETYPAADLDLDAEQLERARTGTEIHPNGPDADPAKTRYYSSTIGNVLHLDIDRHFAIVRFEEGNGQRRYKLLPVSSLDGPGASSDPIVASAREWGDRRQEKASRKVAPEAVALKGVKAYDRGGKGWVFTDSNPITIAVPITPSAAAAMTSRHQDAAEDAGEIEADEELDLAGARR